VPAEPGKRQRPKTVRSAARVRGRRPKVAEVEPLFATYGAEKAPGAVFDEQAADRAVRWIERLRHFKGRWAGMPFYLMGWQARLVRELFGWKRSDGTRLYRRCYVEAPRKSGKSSLASAIALYLAYEDRGKRRQVTPIVNIWGDGRVTTGVEIDGEYVPSGSRRCCESVADCQRPECWARIGYIGEAGVNPAQLW
jgi:hypothetical protein